MLVSVGDPEGWLPLFGEHGFEGEAGEAVSAVFDGSEGGEGGHDLSVDVEVLGFGDFEALGKFGWWGEGLVVQYCFSSVSVSVSVLVLGCM